MNVRDWYNANALYNEYIRLRLEQDDDIEVILADIDGMIEQQYEEEWDDEDE